MYAIRSYYVDYDKRADFLSNADIVISATTSPHHTITYEMLKNCDKKPKYIIDLAMPRDIEPEIKGIREIKYYDVDLIGETASYNFV